MRRGRSDILVSRDLGGGDMHLNQTPQAGIVCMPCQAETLYTSFAADIFHNLKAEKDALRFLVLRIPRHPVGVSNYGMQVHGHLEELSVGTEARRKDKIDGQ